MKVKSTRTYLVVIAILAFASSAGSGDMEFFSFAKPLKYLYILLGPPNTINLKTTVLNTEAHPAPYLVDATLWRQSSAAG